MHLDEIGLISFNPTSGFMKIFNTDTFSIGYYGRILNFDFKNIPKKEIKTGTAVLTKTGLDLAQVNHPNIYKKTDDKDEYIDDFYHYIVEKFFKAKVILSEPLSNKVYNKT